MTQYMYVCNCRVGSVHNRRVTQFIVNELSRRSGFSQAAVESKYKVKRNAHFEEVLTNKSNTQKLISDL